jgi:acyl-CoA thioester hydrolase
MSDFIWPVRVYWEDTDGGGVVYHANYLRFFERARTEWLRARGHVQSEIAATLGVLFALTELHITYRRPARLDDLLAISCEPTLAGAASMAFSQRMHRGTAAGELLAEATVRVACVSATTFRPRRLPAALVKELS